jgi:hypothetical protein
MVMVFCHLRPPNALVIHTESKVKSPPTVHLLDLVDLATIYIYTCPLAGHDIRSSQTTQTIRYMIDRFMTMSSSGCVSPPTPSFHVVVPPSQRDGGSSKKNRVTSGCV